MILGKEVGELCLNLFLKKEKKIATTVTNKSHICSWPNRGYYTPVL